MSRGRDPSIFQRAAGLDADGNHLDGTAELEVRALGGLSRHQRKRRATLRREWEQWRYQRSKLPPDQRGPMLRVGERVCRYCGSHFVPRSLKRRYCEDFKPGDPQYCRRMAGKQRARAKSQG